MGVCLGDGLGATKTRFFSYNTRFWGWGKFLHRWGGGKISISSYFLSSFLFFIVKIKFVLLDFFFCKRPQLGPLRPLGPRSRAPARALKVSGAQIHDSI